MENILKTNIEVFDNLTVDEWKQLIQLYFFSSEEAAKILDVSTPRIYALDKSGDLNSVVKGKYLKSEVMNLAEILPARRKKYRRSEDVLSTETIYALLKDVYVSTDKPVTPQELIAKAEESVEASDQVVIKYRVTNALRILLRKNMIKRISKGHYEPNTY